MDKYRVIDADGHFSEPPDIWDRYLAPEYRYFGPRRTIDNQGRRRWLQGDRLLGMVPPRPSGIRVDNPGTDGGWDPQVRLADMDAQGIEAMVIYSTAGLMFFLEHNELTGALPGRLLAAAARAEKGAASLRQPRCYSGSRRSQEPHRRRDLS